MRNSNKCPRCKHTFKSATHRRDCLHKPPARRRSRSSTRKSGPDWGRVLARSAPMASQSFFSDRKFEGEVIQISTPDASEVTA